MTCPQLAAAGPHPEPEFFVGAFTAPPGLREGKRGRARPFLIGALTAPPAPREGSEDARPRACALAPQRRLPDLLTTRIRPSASLAKTDGRGPERPLHVQPPHGQSALF